MTIANTYPVFEADQVLTNDHLNSMVNYLDQQDRLTRMKLVGSGIVCGLEIEPGNDEIKVTKGCALTSQGFMVLHCDTVYTHFATYTPPSFPDDLQLIQQCPSREMGSIPFYGESFGRGIFQLIAGIWEAIFVAILALVIGLPGVPKDQFELPLFIPHYTLVWLGIYIASQSLMRILFVRWRFKGGQWL